MSLAAVAMISPFEFWVWVIGLGLLEIAMLLLRKKGPPR